jgi:hypothetical protein
MYTEQLSQGLSIAAAPIHPASYAAGTQNTGGVDMQKFRRVMFVLDVGVFGGGATVDMKLQESTDNVTFTDLAGTNVAITQLVAGGGNNREATLEVRTDQITKRYVRAFVTIGTAVTLLCVIPVAGEAVNKPGAKQDDASVAQRQVVA